MMRELSREKQRAIVRALREGTLPWVVARQVRCTVRQVYAVGRRAGIKLRRKLAWGWEGRAFAHAPEPESGLAKLIVRDPEGRIRDPQAGRTWQPSLLGTAGWPSHGYGRTA